MENFFDSNRRKFLKNIAYTSLALPFAFRFKNLLAEKSPLAELGKSESMRILNDRPLNIEASQSLLDEEITPTEKLFVRNNGIVPPIAYATDIKDWRLLIDGEVENPTSFSMEDLKSKFKSYSYQFVIECGGNGRAGYFPTAEGTQWTYGGVGCPLWEGVRLKDLLNYVKVKSSAVYVGYYGHDIHLSGDPNKAPISRGAPIKKALDEMTLIALGMNGKPLPPLHGFPARLICPGYPASASGKWLKRLWIRDCVHDGTKMTGKAYKMPSHPISPGTEISESDFKIIEEMPVKSIITNPPSGNRLKWDKSFQFECRGFAWSGYGDIERVDVSYNFGQTWLKADLKKPRNRFAWQRWNARFPLPTKGYYEIWARATDEKGTMQPMVVPGWNPEGYLNNAMPRIALYADA